MNSKNYKKRDDFKSDGELFFAWYLDDLMWAGYVDSWSYEEEVFELAAPLKLTWQKQMRTKIKDMKMSFLEKCTYNPDFKICWNESAKGILYYNIEEDICDPKDLPYFASQYNVSRIEIKPSHDFQNKTAQAVIKIKWLMQLGTYVQLVIPTPSVSKTGKVSPSNALFHKTFVPDRFFFTNKSMAKRKINFNNLKLDEWLDTKR
tara:strand:- start:2954 stop:3565 length:612 start_codon:yes stop_codon:yes gene_type:complete